MDELVASRPGRKPGFPVLTPDRRRRLIVAAARHVMRRDGIEGVTLPAVARACRVPTSVSLIKHYFGNQEALRQAAEAR